MHHVYVHLLSRLDSRYKSSGNVGGGRDRGRNREATEEKTRWIVSRYWTDVVLHVQMYERNVGAQRFGPANQERHQTDSRHTTMNLHGHAYKCARSGHLTQRQNCVRRKQADS